MMMMIMRKVVGLFFSSESHPEHMSHPAYQQLPISASTLFMPGGNQRKKETDAKKKAAGFCLFYLPVLVFLRFRKLHFQVYFVSYVTCNTEDRAKYVRSFASSFFFELVQY